MMSLRALAIAALLIFAGCGGGDSPQPPVETLLYVSGGPNIDFGFPMNDLTCPPDGTGIEAPNASHQFGDRLFQTPHLFVMENIQQPVQATIKNMGSDEIRAFLYLGINPQVTNFVIPAGECRRIAVTSLPQPTPVPLGAQVQVEVCAPMGDPSGVNLNTSCISDPVSDPPPPDVNVGFFSTLGDIEVTHITNCTLSPILDACRTPATFFLEQPKDEIDAIMSVNPGQVNGVVRLEVYVNGTLVGVEGGSNPVVTDSL